MYVNYELETLFVFIIRVAATVAFGNRIQLHMPFEQ